MKPAVLKKLIFVLLFLNSTVAVANCGATTFTAADKVRLAGKSVMIVTHATAFHDASMATKRGVDEAVRFAKNNKIPTIYLKDESPDDLYFMADCTPDYWVKSQGGEIEFPVTPDHYYVVGGHLELCLSGTVHDVILSWAKQKKLHVTLTYLMDAIYSNGKSVEPTDAFYKDFSTFMRIVTYGRPAGEHWTKLTLLETLGAINSEVDELSYLEKILPHWENTFPAEYRVELQLHNSVVKVLRAAPGWRPPTVRFHFVDSAAALDIPAGF